MGHPVEGSENMFTLFQVLRDLPDGIRARVRAGGPPAPRLRHHPRLPKTKKSQQQGS